MLGKGLESLIPPKRNQDPQNSQQNPASPQVSPIVPPTEDNGAQTFVEKPRLVAERLNDTEMKAIGDMPTAVPDNAGREEHKPIAKEKEPLYAEPKRDEAIFQIEVDSITSNPHQPRRNFEEEG